ncbi:hypothetical protein EDD16DRAFT_1640024 [Pisolithus croceorrhizus]|nr:hypothetical protein EDD16DRAFT_1640024 [Pisolithus croceorrhizus]KAI6115037.1 hypothetical protein EV401DRAFT_1978402 [Pisolithus croceorrhizus]
MAALHTSTSCFVTNPFVSWSSHFPLLMFFLHTYNSHNSRSLPWFAFGRFSVFGPVCVFYILCASVAHYRIFGYFRHHVYFVIAPRSCTASIRNWCGYKRHM